MKRRGISTTSRRARGQGATTGSPRPAAPRETLRSGSRLAKSGAAFPALFAAWGLAAWGLAACGDSAPPTPDKARTEASASAPPSAVITLGPSASASDSPAPEASASASASASAPAPEASAEASASASASGAAPAVKGFAFPSPKSGVLSVAEANKLLPSGGKPKVRLIDAGREPLSAVSYSPTKGETAPLAIDLTQKVAIAAEGQPAPAVLSPPQALEIDVTTEDADGGGALVAMALKGIKLQAVDGLDADVLGELTKQLTGLRGYTFRERLNARGEASEVKVELPATAPKGSEMLVNSMGAVLRTMIPVLPSEEVGTGAKWQVLSRDDLSGASVVQLTEYTLKERSGSRVTLDLKTRQVAAGDDVALPTGTPEGVTTKLTKFSTTSSGSLVIDTKQMGPIKGKVTQDSKLGLDVLAAGKAGVKMKTQADMKMTVSISRRGGAATAASSAASGASAAPSAGGAPK